MKTNGKLDKERAKIFVECKKKGIEKIKACFHPGYAEPSINSHILQQNGILSSIVSDHHVWEQDINPFYDPKFRFKRRNQQ